VQHLASELNASAVSELSSAADASGVVVWHSPAFRQIMLQIMFLEISIPVRVRGIIMIKHELLLLTINHESWFYSP